jgi:hypothetical protein
MNTAGLAGIQRLGDRHARRADRASSCQDLAQTTHHYTIPQQRRKPALEQACQRRQRGKAHPAQPPLLPTEYSWHRPDCLQQADHALAPQAAPELGQATEPLLAPAQQVRGQAS